mmetsp:Transcript_18808/g.46684  ORF Transcript_18808/g.46684 Transcript_18808/m.46684 type:complete len:244 (-) Transcript_18808:1053-1784(-)
MSQDFFHAFTNVGFIGHRVGFIACGHADVLRGTRLAQERFVGTMLSSVKNLKGSVFQLVLEAMHSHAACQRCVDAEGFAADAVGFLGESRRRSLLFLLLQDSPKTVQAGSSANRQCAPIFGFGGVEIAQVVCGFLCNTVTFERNLLVVAVNNHGGNHFQSLKTCCIAFNGGCVLSKRFDFKGWQSEFPVGKRIDIAAVLVPNTRKTREFSGSKRSLACINALAVVECAGNQGIESHLHGFHHD